LLAIVVAFKEEVKDYLRRHNFKLVAHDKPLRFYESRQEPEVVVVDGAFGRRRAEEATREIVQRYRPDYIVSAGFAGGTRKGLRPGDLFICNRLMTMEGPASLWGVESLNEKPPLEVALPQWVIERDEPDREEIEYGGCMSVTQLVPSSHMKEWIGTTYSVSVIDMESYWVSETAASYGVPHVVVRSVLDPLEQTLPKFVSDTVSDEDPHRWRRAITYLATHLSETPKLLRLPQQVNAASASLDRFLAQLAPAAS